MIIASILLAFGIDAWWQERQQLQAERQQIRALTADFTENLRLLEERREQVQSYVDGLGQLLELLRSSPPGGEITVPGSSVAALVRGIGTIDPVRGTLDAMIGSGSLDQLSDADLRAALAEWPSLVSDVHTDQIALQEYVTLELIPFLATQGDYSRVLDLDAEGAPVRIQATPQAITMVAGKRIWDQWIVRDIGPLIESTEAILGKLQAQH